MKCSRPNFLPRFTWLISASQLSFERGIGIAAAVTHEIQLIALGLCVFVSQKDYSHARRMEYCSQNPPCESKTRLIFLTAKEQSKNAVYYELIHKDLRKQFLIFISFAVLLLGDCMILLSLSWSNFTIADCRATAQLFLQLLLAGCFQK